MFVRVFTRTKKRFGQHFLTDPHIIHAILDAFKPQVADTVVEIGPGLGALTKPLLSKLNHLYAIELDRDIIAQIKHWSRLTVIEGDALNIDYAQWQDHQIRLIGNLPYNISTPLLLKLMQQTTHIKDMLFMLQKEVADSICAQQKLNRLSVMIQYYCHVVKVLEVPPHAFTPPPRVESTVICLIPYTSLPAPLPYPAVPFSALETWVARSFAMRRKTIANNLKPWVAAAELQAMGIAPGLRPEQLSIHNFVHLAKLHYT